jgi:hypothetical protein
MPGPGRALKTLWRLQARSLTKHKRKLCLYTDYLAKMVSGKWMLLIPALSLWKSFVVLLALCSFLPMVGGANIDGECHAAASASHQYPQCPPSPPPQDSSRTPSGDIDTCVWISASGDRCLQPARLKIAYCYEHAMELEELVRKQYPPKEGESDADRVKREGACRKVFHASNLQTFSCRKCCVSSSHKQLKT